MSTSPEGRRLRAFRLSEVPVETRMRAASAVSRSIGRAHESAANPADRLFARLLADRDAGGDSTDAAVLREVAARPSDRVYWIPRDAWERVMGR